MSARPTKPVAMCCVRIDYQEFIMPADKGKKVVELLQSAFKCNKRLYDDATAYRYEINEQPQIEFALVRPNQVAEPPAAASGRLRLGR